MKLIDKLKNALFEEEYVEVEEKPKRKEIKKERKPKEPHIKEKPIKKERKEEKVEEKPIAKKIVQEKKETPKEEVTQNEDEHLGESLAYKKELENEFKFPMVSDSEFKTDDYLEEQPKKAKKFKKFSSAEKPLYQGKKKKEPKPYGLDELDLQEHEYGAYEKKEERTYFKPSPIISPIYGILDKNYTKDDITPKKEIRLTSTYARENMNVDDVRQKAFGTLENDLKKEIEDMDSYEDNEEEDANNSFLDLSSDTKTPEVNKVTMGDAEEYFEDLGLEYNVDYKDTSKEKASGRRTKKDYDDREVEESVETEDNYDSVEEDYDIEEEQQDDEETKREVKISDSNDAEETDDDDDNLFDLIDSMYDKE